MLPEHFHRLGVECLIKYASYCLQLKPLLDFTSKAEYLVCGLEVGGGRVQCVEVSNCALNNNDTVADLDEDGCPVKNKPQWVSAQFSQFDPNAVTCEASLLFPCRTNCYRGTARTAGLQDQPGRLPL